MLLAHVSEGGRRTGLSWPNFKLEDILNLPSPISFPQFPETMVFPNCLWGPQNPRLCSGLTPTPEFLLLLPSLQPPLCFLLPAIFLLRSAADFPSRLICEHAPWSRAQQQRTPLPVQKTQERLVQSLRGEDLLEEGMATHSSVPAWKILWSEEPGGLRSMGLQRVRAEHMRTHTKQSRKSAQKRAREWMGGPARRVL